MRVVQLDGSDTEVLSPAQVASHEGEGALAWAVTKQVCLRMLRRGILVCQNVVGDCSEAWSLHWAACAGMPGSGCALSGALCDSARFSRHRLACDRRPLF